MLAKAGYPGSSVHIPDKLPPPMGAPIPICSHKSHQWPAWTGAVWQGATFRCVVSQLWSFVEGEVYPSAIQISSEHGKPNISSATLSSQIGKKKTMFFWNGEPNPTKPFCWSFLYEIHSILFRRRFFYYIPAAFLPDFHASNRTLDRRRKMPKPHASRNGSRWHVWFGSKKHWPKMPLAKSEEKTLAQFYLECLFGRSLKIFQNMNYIIYSLFTKRQNSIRYKVCLYRL